MHHLMLDIRYGCRTLGKSPAFTLVAVLTLALGMGACTVVISILNALYLGTATVRNPDELVMSIGKQRGVSLPEYLYYRDHNTSFLGLAAEYPTAHTFLQSDYDSEIVLSAVVSANYFELLGVKPFLGRFFVPAEEHLQGTQVAVLGYGLWKNKFGGDQNLVGKTIRLNSIPATIVGVAPPEFHRLFSGIDDDLWLVSGAAALAPPRCKVLDYKCDFFAGVIGRLKPGKNLGSATAELNGLNQHWEGIYPDLEKNKLTFYPARGIDPHNRLEIEHLPLILILSVAVLLLITCANLSGLLLVRGISRSKEIAIRVALGAARGRVIRQLLIEAALLAFLGTALGMFLSFGASGWLSAFPFASTEGFRSFYKVGVDLHVLAAVAALSIVTVLIFGLTPAVRVSSIAPIEAVKQGGSSGRSSSWSGYVLVSAQVALAVFLSTGAMLASRSLAHVLHGPGFNGSHISIVRVSPYRVGYTPTKSAQIQTEVLRRISAIPGVEAVSFGQLMPWWESWQAAVALPGQEDARPEAQLTVHFNNIAPNYLRTLNIPLLRGREFTESDRKGSPNVVIVNQSLARRMWAAKDPIGQTLAVDGTKCTVVGIANDAQFTTATDDNHFFFYLPYWQVQNNGDSRFLVRTASDPGIMLRQIKRVVRDIDSNVPIGEDTTMTEALLNDFGSLRLTRVLLVFAGVAAFTLSAVGLYGLLSFLVSRRTREIGIRLALGATPHNLQQSVLRQGMKLALAGGIAGATLSVLGLRILKSLLYGITATDPVTLIGVYLLLVAVCALASYLPARRALQVDPMVALRYE
jgi:putative ABC transport system permease protein